MSKEGRIKTLEGLRSLAFLGVVFCHTGLARKYFERVGYWGVSVFFILSGFVAVLSHYEKRDFKPSISYNFTYLVNHIKKLYPLHILTALAFIIFDFVGEYKPGLKSALFKLGLNAFFLQEWLPLYTRSLNGVSWFLCTSVLFYFIFPWVLKHLQNGYTKKKAMSGIIVCVLMEVVIVALSLLLPRPAYTKNMFWTYDTVSWFVYKFPLSRIFDCFIGCYLGALFLNEEREISFSTGKEALSLLLGIVSIVISSVVRPITPTGSAIPLVDYTIGWSYSLIFLPGTISIVYFFAKGEGKISKFFTHPMFMYLARISPYAFLIHLVVFKYIESALYVLIGNKDKYTLFSEHYLGGIKLTIGFFLTLVATQIWMWLTMKVKTRRDTIEEKNKKGIQKE